MDEACRLVATEALTRSEQEIFQDLEKLGISPD